MSKSYHQPRRMKQNPWRKRLILFACLVVLVFCIGLLAGYLKTRAVPRTEPAAVNNTSQLTRDVTLYFASADGQALAAEARKLRECQNDEDCLSDTIEALIAGPLSDLAPIMATQVVLRGLTVSDNLVTVDFNQEMIATHPGGTQSELLTIYGLVDTLVVNSPYLRQVQILIEGAPVPTLKGHVDLRRPVNPDFSLVEEGGREGRIISLPAGGDE